MSTGFGNGGAVETLLAVVPIKIRLAKNTVAFLPILNLIVSTFLQDEGEASLGMLP
jgi:hypothetical protein